jgi:hypothetical protein
MLESVLAALVLLLPCVAIIALLVDAIRSAMRGKPAVLATGQGHLYQVVGTAHYQQALKRLLAAAPDRRITVRLVPTPGDPYDRHAVAVQDAAGATLAHLPAEDAPSYGRVLEGLRARRIEPVCSARLIGGEDAGAAVDIRLDLDRPMNIARRHRITVHLRDLELC